MLALNHRRLRGNCLMAAGFILATAFAGASAGTDASAGAGVLQVRPDVYMVTVDGVNVGVETGPQGTVVVDTGGAHSADALLAAIKEVRRAPISFVIDTSADEELVGGNARVAGVGASLAGLLGFNRVSGVASAQLGNGATIVGRQSTLQDMIARGQTDPASLPTETFTRPQYNLWLNGQAIEVIAEKAAHSDADSVVLFRRSDVVVAGAIFDITRFPAIDLQHGGSIDGEVDALNQLLNALVMDPVPVVTNDEGTLVIPERGPVCNQADVIAYRDMVYAVRYRVEDLIKRGRNLAQIEAADPTQGYNSRYGAASADGGTAFVKTVYTSLMARHRAAAPAD